MSGEEFLRIYAQIVNEFHILNEHFDSRERSKTFDYDVVFGNCTKDMTKRFKSISLSMHWATSSTQIAKNQLLFDTRHKDEYFCEIKYNFNSEFVTKFVGKLKDFLGQFEWIVKDFNRYCDKFDFRAHPKVVDFEKDFPVWKKEVYQNYADVILDYHWGNKNELLTQNLLFLTLMFGDDYLCEIRYRFFDENSVHKILDIDNPNNIDDLDEIVI